MCSSSSPSSSKFALGYSPLAAGLRIAPIAVSVLVVAPLAVLGGRRIGTKPVVVTGLVAVAVGLGWLAQSTVSTTYGQCVLPLVLIGVGVAMTLSPCTASIMSSLPTEEAGVGSATNDTAMQVGAALGVGVLGTALTFRYQDLLAPTLTAAHVPVGIRGVIEGSLGGALAVAQRAPSPEASRLADTAHRAFISGMDLALVVAMAVAIVAALLALTAMPNRSLGSDESIAGNGLQSE